MNQEYEGRVTQIVTKAVCARGKKRFVNEHVLKPDFRPEKILGYWVGNHHYSAKTFEDSVVINGRYEVTVWYSFDDQSKTDLTKKSFTFSEQIPLKDTEGRLEREEEVLVTERLEPTCMSARVESENLVITVVKAFSVEIIGETKMAIVAYPASILEADEDEDEDEDDAEDYAEEYAEDYEEDYADDNAEGYAMDEEEEAMELSDEGEASEHAEQVLPGEVANTLGFFGEE